MYRSHEREYIDKILITMTNRALTVIFRIEQEVTVIRVGSQQGTPTSHILLGPESAIYLIERVFVFFTINSHNKDSIAMSVSLDASHGNRE